MTPKQTAFVQEYMKDLNGTQAAIRAGYSADTATEQASRLLTNVKVASAIAELQADRAEQCGIDALWVLQKAKETFEAAFTADNHSAAVSALKLVGSHVDVNAFEERIANRHSGNVGVTEIRLVGPDES